MVFDNETIRTLSLAFSTIVTTGLVSFFGYLTITRKEKIEKYKTELRSAYIQFGKLYLVEQELLERLATDSNSPTKLKRDIRAEVIGNSEEKIVLTYNSVKLKLTQL